MQLRRTRTSLMPQFDAIRYEGWVYFLFWINICNNDQFTAVLRDQQTFPLDSSGFPQEESKHVKSSLIMLSNSAPMHDYW